MIIFTQNFSRSFLHANNQLMRLYYLFIICALFVSKFELVAQQTNDVLTVSFENATLAEFLNIIEYQSDVRFYFVEEWLPKEIKITERFENQSLDEILTKVLDKTPLNFHIQKPNRVILTQRDRIYTKVPEGFFGNKSTENPKENIPVVRNDLMIDEGWQSSKRTKIETIRIGKSTAATLSDDVYTISGTLTNKATRLPLKNSIILINDKLADKSDTKGNYELRISRGTHLIKIVSPEVGTVTKRLIIYNHGRLDLNLEEQLQQLDAVVLRSPKSNTAQEATTKTVIDIENAKNIPLALGERDVLKVATTLPGISTTGEGAIGYNVRGGKSDQNLILLDEAIIYNPQHFFGIFSALNPFAIGDVSIYKSGIPASYGGRLSSVFDMTTKSGDTTKVSGQGSVGPVTGNVLVEAPVSKGKSSVLLGGRAAYANWILKNLDDPDLQRSQASFFDAVGNYTHHFSKKSKLKASGYWSRDDFSITSDSLYIYGNRAFSLQWDQKFTAPHQLKVSLANSQYSFDINYENEDSNNNFELGYEVNETELKVKSRYRHSDQLKLDYGISSKLYNINPGQLQPLGANSDIVSIEVQKERALESAAHLSINYDITPKIKIEPGLRYSLFQVFGGRNIREYVTGVPRSEETVSNETLYADNDVIETYQGAETRVALRYLLSDRFSIKASYNKTFQYIHTLSNNTSVSPIDSWKLSDTHIKPQGSEQYSIGVYKSFEERGYELNLEGFYKRMDNVLDFKTGAEVLLNPFIETEVLQGKGRAYGIEFLLKKEIGKLYGWLGYTYSRSYTTFDSSFGEEQINEGQEFPSNFDKPHDFSLVTNYRFTKRFSLATNFVYQTGRPITVPVGQFNFNGIDYPVFSNRNEFRIPDYYRLDIGFNIEGNHKVKKAGHGFWTISIYNVFGRNNPYSVFFVTDNGKVKGLQSSIFSVPVPSITYNFKF